MKIYQQQLLISELMGTLESLITYTNNHNVREQAMNRLEQLKHRNGEINQLPPLGNFIIKNKFICQPKPKKQPKR